MPDAAVFVCLSIVWSIDQCYKFLIGLHRIEIAEKYKTLSLQIYFI